VCVRLLEEAGVDKDIKDIDGLTYLDHQVEFLRKAEEARIAKEIAKAREDARKGAEAATQKYGPRKTLLIATEQRDEWAVKALLAVGYPAVDESDWTGTTVLQKAARMGCDSIVQALLAAGASNVDWALILAACNGREGCVKVLLAAGANKEAEGSVSSR